ncbi:MAG TPA: hypothetical protein VK694_07430 [Verrucomicrobiae bacterium]|nr:hypothetical protein [Verrucomicrobiae bacterium]
MSETPQNHSIEKKRIEAVEAAPAPEKHRSKEASTGVSVEHDHNIDKIQASIHKEAVSGKDVAIEHHRSESQPALGLQRELKATAYQKTLHKVQARLNPTQRSFSKVIHQPLVESVSEASAKTVARPSGILGGGLVALIGSGGLLYMAKHYGFKYNYFVFIALFLAGFLVGSAIELSVRAVKRR